MPLEGRLLVGLAIASAVVYWATPVAIRIAERLEFYDRPVGYKGHLTPTPYLGGAAVVAGFVLAVLVLERSPERTLPLVCGGVLLWAVGTVDDWRTVKPVTRVVIEVGVAVALWALGLGWDLGLGAAVDVAASAVWIVAIVNAFNLFDNMDGAASSVGAVVAAGLVVFGLAQDMPWVAVCAIAMCGACLGFLPHNLLRSPARIFLGDGGSMPLGFLAAALTMASVSTAAPSWQSLAMGLLFVGIPVLDTALVLISRHRRGIPLLTGGRDHLTHRTQRRVRSVRAVAFALGGAQAVVSAMAVVAVRGGSGLIVAAVVLYLTAAAVAIAVFDTDFARPTRTAEPVERVAPVRRRLPLYLLLVPLGAGIAASPFFGGYYSSRLWVPIGLGLLAVATAGLIARPPRLTRPAVLAVAGLAGLALLSLLSVRWAGNAEEAYVSADRLLVYLVLALVLLVAVRTDRAAAWLLGSLAVGSLVVAGWTLVRLLGSDAASGFLGLRLHEPLGYINGQGAFFVVATWLFLAAAEQRRWPLLSGAGLAAAVLSASLALLSQSRGVALSALVAAGVTLAIVPGRVRRAWTIAALGAGMAPALPSLLAVYDNGVAGAVDPATLDDAGRAALLCALGAGIAWGALTAAASHLERRVPLTRRLAAVAVAMTAVAGLAVGVASAGTVERTVSDQYNAFVHLAPEQADPSSRLLSGSGRRYDYWRVAWAAFRENPVGGVGAGNYPEPYFARRATAEDVRQPHSIELQTLAELGLAGAALLALLVAGLGWGAWRSARAARASALGRTLAVAGVGAVTTWLVHTSVDWLHLIPGVTAMALVAGAVLVRPVAEPRPARSRPWARLVLVAATGLLLAVTCVLLARQGLTELYLARAQTALPNDPAKALTEADRALRIDRNRLDAYYVKSAALARFDRGPAAVATLREAARRVPSDFVTWALLGDLATRMGDRRAARRYYDRALALNPMDPSLRALAREPY